MKLVKAFLMIVTINTLVNYHLERKNIPKYSNPAFLLRENNLDFSKFHHTIKVSLYHHHKDIAKNS